MSGQLLTISPEILGWTPVFFNTRVPVKNLFDYLKGGDSLEDFLTDFPSVSREQVLKVLSLAENALTINPANEAAAWRKPTSRFNPTITFSTVSDESWNSVKNGELLKLMQANSYTIFSHGRPAFATLTKPWKVRYSDYFIG